MVGKKDDDEKTEESFSIKIKAEITNEQAILNALMANAAAFNLVGGSPLMLTEHVENGIDAIKDRANWKGEYDRKKIGKIDIIIDEENAEVRVIDDGSGILDPIWILHHPMYSKKLGLELTSSQVGKYGRGLQGFRGFCKTLEYITVREQPHKTERSIYDKAIEDGRLDKRIDPRCIKLTLEKSTIEGDCKPVYLSKFRKYTNHNTGTVAIFRDWLDGQFEVIMRKLKDIANRIQHHFRHDLENELVEIYLHYDNKIDKIEPRDFSHLDRYELEDRIVYDPVINEKIGTIQFFLYKCSGEYKHQFKAPFLLTKDNRPLQDSFIYTMPEFKDEKVWSSTFVTGYIKCDFVEPDNLRIALSTEGKNVKNNRLFVNSLRSCAIDLKRLIREYQSGLSQFSQENENRNIIIEIQNFLRKQKVKLELPSLTEMGIMKQGESESRIKNGRISAEAGKTNEGRASIDGTDQVVMLYEKRKKTENETPHINNLENDQNDDNVIIKKRLRVTIPDKDGRSQKSILIDPNMLSKGGRQVRKPSRGINLKPAFERINEEISYSDPGSMTVYINFLHPLYIQLGNLKKKSAESIAVYSTKQKNYIRSRYLWELIKNFYKKDDDKYEEYWKLNHKFFIFKSEK